MVRLIWKDAVAARWLLLAGLPMYVLNLAAFSDVRPVGLSFSLVVSALLAFGSLAMEEIQGTEMLWASLPVRRADIVFARYLTTLLGAALGLAISLGVERLTSAVRAASTGAVGLSLAASAGIHAVELLLLLLAAAVLLPLCFRLGAGNGALAFGAIAIAAVLVLSFGSQIALWLAGMSNPLLDPDLYRGAPDNEQVQAAMEWLRLRGGALLGLCALVTAAALTVSVALSRSFFEARDLSS